MYICICKGITHKQLQEASQAARNYKDVCKQLGVGSECGVCLEDAYKQLLAETQSPQQTHSPQKSRLSKNNQ